MGVLLGKYLLSHVAHGHVVSLIVEYKELNSIRICLSSCFVDITYHICLSATNGRPTLGGSVVGAVFLIDWYLIPDASILDRLLSHSRCQYS